MFRVGACWLLLLLLLVVVVAPRPVLVSAKTKHPTTSAPTTQAPVPECANVTAAPGEVWTRVPYNFQGGTKDLSILTCSPGYTWGCHGVPATPRTDQNPSGDCTDGKLCYHSGQNLYWQNNMLIDIGTCIPTPTSKAQAQSHDMVMVTSQSGSSATDNPTGMTMAAQLGIISGAVMLGIVLSIVIAYHIMSRRGATKTAHEHALQAIRSTEHV